MILWVYNTVKDLKNRIFLLENNHLQRKIYHTLFQRKDAKLSKLQEKIHLYDKSFMLYLTLNVILEMLLSKWFFSCFIFSLSEDRSAVYHTNLQFCCQGVTQPESLHFLDGYKIETFPD